MKFRDHLVGVLICALLASQLAGCATSPAAPTPARTIPDSPLVEIAVLTTTKNAVDIPPKSRIVVSDITGPCSVELKNALTRRLVDNADYEVVSRDNMDKILIESKSQWAGNFNTETAIKLGQLLGASLFIVGEVVYCGSPGRSTFSYQRGSSFDVFAVLQMIDPETGKVILSSANEGKYLPDSDPLLYKKSAGDYEPPSTAGQTDGSSRSDGEAASAPRKRFQRIIEKSRKALKRAGLSAERFEPFAQEHPALPALPEGSKVNQEASTGNYPAFKASENLADRFADKFFSRPIWETVEMFKNSYWEYGNSVWLVKLGQCPLALSTLEERATPQVPRMSPPDVAEYLHNYGVALLCANQPERALEKLRSAYRLGNKQASLRMLGLASKIIEWSLTVEIDRQPEIDMLVGRSR